MKCSNCSNFGWRCQGGVRRFMSLGFVKKITFHPCKKLPATQLNLMIHLLFLYVFLLSFGKIRFCPGNKVVLSNSGVPLNSNVQYRDDHTKIYHILSDSHSTLITYPIILLIPIHTHYIHIYPCVEHISARHVSEMSLPWGCDCPNWPHEYFPFFWTAWDPCGYTAGAIACLISGTSLDGDGKGEIERILENKKYMKNIILYILTIILSK